MGNAEYMGVRPPRHVMKNISRTKASKRKPWFRGKYVASATKAIAKEESAKGPRYYATEDKKVKLTNSRCNNKKTKLKASLVPGTVVILLAGRFKGRRAVFLKQLDSGLLLITGPYKVNGIPLRRVPQSYVIATQTKVDLAGVKVPDTVNDDLFKKPKSAKKKDDELFFEKDKEATIDESRKALQKQVDEKLCAGIAKTPLLKAYLASKFSLKKGQKPHEMVF